MEGLREWLMGVVAASMLTAVVQAVMPEGAVKKVGQMACGLALFLAVVSPILGARYTQLVSLLDEYEQQLAETESELEETEKTLTASFIDEETGAYIQGKTEELGVTCQVQVIWDWSGEVPEPSGAMITGELTTEEQTALTQALSEDLALEPSQITYEEGAEP